jgi:hypothetical protein
MLRVSLDHARPDAESSGKISGLEFAPNPGGKAQASATGRLRSPRTGSRFGTDTIFTLPGSNLDHEVGIDLEARDVHSASN